MKKVVVTLVSILTLATAVNAVVFNWEDFKASYSSLENRLAYIESVDSMGEGSTTIDLQNFKIRETAEAYKQLGTKAPVPESKWAENRAKAYEMFYANLSAFSYETQIYWYKQDNKFSQAIDVLMNNLDKLNAFVLLRQSRELYVLGYMSGENVVSVVKVASKKTLKSYEYAFVLKELNLIFTQNTSGIRNVFTIDDKKEIFGNFLNNTPINSDTVELLTFVKTHYNLVK